MRGGGEEVIAAERVDGEKKLHVIREPDFTFHVTKPDRFDPEADPPLAIPVEDCEPVSCKWRHRYDAMVEVAYDYGSQAGDGARGILDGARSSEAFGNLRRMHDAAWLHGSDDDLADHYYDRWVRKNAEDQVQAPRLLKGYWDIEVDHRRHEGFPDAKTAPCPIIAISYFASHQNRLYGLFSTATEEPCPAMDKFLDGSLAQWAGSMAQAASKEIGRKVEVELRFLDGELDLIKEFFGLVHQPDGPDVMLAWNQAYDLGTICSRLEQHHGVRPGEIMADQTLPPRLRRAWFHEDETATSMWAKRDRWHVAGGVMWTDQMLNYMRIRAGMSRLESYSLDNVLDHELDLRKEAYDGRLAELPYRDFEKFVRYSLMDSFRLGILEESLGDADILYDMSLFTRTRFEKTMTKTVCLKNLTRIKFQEFGMILSNNRAHMRAEGDSIRGGFVADPNLNEKVGERLHGARSDKVFRNVCDFDLTALYPSEIIAFCINATEMIGLPDFGDKPDEDGQDQATGFADAMACGDALSMGADLLGLPGRRELAETINDIS